jgi:hypothetical protein
LMKRARPLIEGILRQPTVFRKRRSAIEIGFCVITRGLIPELLRLRLI